MPTQEVREAEPTNVVITGFTDAELTEMRRGLVQRMVVGKSNLLDKRNPDDYAAWGEIYRTCWSAYKKLLRTVAQAPEPAVIQDEYEYLTGR